MIIWEKNFYTLRNEIARNHSYNREEKYTELSKLIKNEESDQNIEYYVNEMKSRGFQISLSDKIML